LVLVIIITTAKIGADETKWRHRPYNNNNQGNYQYFQLGPPVPSYHLQYDHKPYYQPAPATYHRPPEAYYYKPNYHQSYPRPTLNYHYDPYPVYYQTVVNKPPYPVYPKPIELVKPPTTEPVMVKPINQAVYPNPVEVVKPPAAEMVVQPPEPLPVLVITDAVTAVPPVVVKVEEIPSPDEDFEKMFPTLDEELEIRSSPAEKNDDILSTPSTIEEVPSTTLVSFNEEDDEAITTTVAPIVAPLVVIEESNSTETNATVRLVITETAVVVSEVENKLENTSVINKELPKNKEEQQKKKRRRPASQRRIKQQQQSKLLSNSSTNATPTDVNYNKTTTVSV